MGPPGAGKGTQANKLKSFLNVPHISTGEIFRNAISNKTDLGIKAKTFIDAGELVPDDLTINLIKERLIEPDCSNGFILDGFPRTLDQAKALDDLIAELNIEINKILKLEISEELIISRIRSRAEKKNSSTRTDDNEKVLRNRLNVYCEQTQPVCNYYNESNRLSLIDASLSVENVFNEIKSHLG